MRGREKFELCEPILNCCVGLARALPRGVCLLLFEAVKYLPTNLGLAARYILLRRLARRCGRCVAIYDGVHLKSIDQLEIGDNVSIHAMSYVDAAGGVVIGNDVSIAHSCSIVSHEHDYKQNRVPIREAPSVRKAIRIGSNVWLGCGVRILGGVMVGDGSVVGAGSVVTRGVAMECVVAGVPARPLMRRSVAA